MRISGRDAAFVAAAGIILGILLTNVGKDKPKKIPADSEHLALVRMGARNGDREKAERVCATCHNSRIRPLPAKHPPKEQCLLCHRVDG